MGKKLSEMTLEELWQLFPIYLTAPDARWRTYFAEMRAELDGLLAAYLPKCISHIGSTAINGIWAKPIVDVLVELPAVALPEAAQEYEKLKMELWKQYEHDRDGYTAAKTEFVARYTQKAKES